MGHLYDFKHVATAETPRNAIPEDISVELSMALLDLDGKLRAACDLWEAWGLEEGRVPDIQAFAHNVLTHALNQTGMVLVAYSEYGLPVGMVSVGWDYDPAKSRTRMIVERLYVLPEYRDKTVFRALRDGLRVVATLVDVGELVVSCRAGSHLQKVYEAEGFEVTDYIMKSDAWQRPGGI